MALVDTLKAKQAVAEGTATPEQEALILGNGQPVIEHDAPIQKPYNPPKGAYKALNLRELIKSNGQRVKCNIYGFFEPKDKEEEELLSYFATRYNLVEAV